MAELDLCDRFTRSRWIFGEKFEILQNSKILVCGCGGVGGAVIEALYRSGVINLSVIDCDEFDITNQNRQFASESLGEKKALVFERKFDGVRGICAKIGDEFLAKFDVGGFDFIIDCIDDIPAKIALAKISHEKNIKFISSLGAARRIDPSKIELVSVWKTHGDPFARKFRSELKKANFTGDFVCAFSSESPVCERLGSFMGVTASFGLIIASYVVQNLINEK